MIATILLAAALSTAPEIIDGDTVTIAGERIRLATIDAPEIRHAQCDAERRLAEVAKRRLGELLAAGTIEIVRGDPATGRVKDRHGRTLAVVLVDGRDVGVILIEERLARPWSGKREPWCD